MNGNNLVIYDVSHLIHVGVMSQYVGGAVNGLKFDGGRYLLEKVFTHLREGRAVALCFDAQCDKRNEFPEYRGNREFNADVAIQRQAVLQLCQLMKLPVYWKNGYEADEHIFNIVRTNLKVCSQIDIYCNDADIASNIIHKKVTCIGCGSNGKTLTTALYPFGIIKGKEVKYNTILPYIVIYGKDSNNIPSIQLETTASLKNIYLDFLSWCDKKNIAENERSEQRVITMWLISKHGLLSSVDMETFKKRIRMIYPRKITDIPYLVSFDILRKLDKNWVLGVKHKLRFRSQLYGEETDTSEILEYSRRVGKILAGYKDKLDSGDVFGWDNGFEKHYDNESVRMEEGTSLFTVEGF